MNGAPAPLAEDEDSDFGHESWYDRKGDKKGKTKDRRGGKRGGARKSGTKNLVNGDDDRAADFNLLDHGFPSGGSDEESFFDSDRSKSSSPLRMYLVCSASLDIGTPAFVLERRGQHKPLSSYFEDTMLDREGSVDHGAESHRQSGSRTQEGSKRGRRVNTAVGSSDVETPTNSMLRQTPPDDEGSVTGKFKSGHQLAHDSVDVTSPESETEADLDAFAQSIVKRKYPGHPESPSKRQKLSADDGDSVTESDDDGHCMYLERPCSPPSTDSAVPSPPCYRVWPSIYPSPVTLVSMT